MGWIKKSSLQEPHYFAYKISEYQIPNNIMLSKNQILSDQIIFGPTIWIILEYCPNNTECNEKLGIPIMLK